MGAAEWLITSVDSFMLLQVAWCCAFVVTLGAAEWFITSVDSFMLLQVAWCCAFDVILGAVEWFITSVDSFMLLQVASCCAFVVTLGAVEWFITSVDSFMPAQAQPDFLSPWTRLFDIWSVSLAVANILLPVWRNLVCGNFIQIKFTNAQVFGKQKNCLYLVLTHGVIPINYEEEVGNNYLSW